MNSNMYHAYGNTIWSFLLAVFVLVCVFALGLNVNDALTAPAQINRMNTETDVERQKSEIDLQLYWEQTQAQIEELRRQREAAALKQAQNAEFYGKMLNAIVVGVEAIFIGFAVAIAAYGFRSATPQPTRAETHSGATAPDKPLQVNVRSCMPKSPEGQRAKQNELSGREQTLKVKNHSGAEPSQPKLGNTKIVWSQNGREEHGNPPRSVAG